MNCFRYLKEHAGWIGIWMFLVITIEIMLMTLDGSVEPGLGLTLKLYVGIGLTVAVILGTFIDYRKSRKFMDFLENVSDSLDRKYLLPEMIGEGSNQEQVILVRILKEMEQSMADNVADHRRLAEEYKDYIETWVHEVKIPIATAGMIIENHKDEKVGEVGLDAEIKRIQSYVEQALFFARSEAVEKDYMIKEIDLEEIAGSVIFDKKRILREKRASIDIHDMNTSKKVCSDSKWISFIISQIIDNSIKYAKEDTPLSLEIWLSEDEHVALHIKDNGVGMKSGEKDRIFEKGFTGTNGRNVGASTGMGLYLCSKLCKRLEHDLRAESVQGEGTEMIIEFQ